MGKWINLWKDLIKGKKFYWVEDFKDYHPPAYRILIADNDYSTSKLVTPYPVEDRSGPIYFDGEEWYRNGYYTGEFLIDQDLDVNSCLEIEFVDHHNRVCSKSGSRCCDIKLSKYKAGSRFLANIIGRNLTHMRDQFWDKSTKEQQLTFQAQGAINTFFRLFQKRCSKKSTKLTLSKKHFLARACLCALSENNTDFLDSIVSMLGTEEDVFNILKQVVEQFFDCKFHDIADW